MAARPTFLICKLDEGLGLSGPKLHLMAAERTNPLLLIADDDRAGRLILTRLLKSDNFDIEFAEDGEEAVIRARELKPDLLLLDVLMPKKDGFEVCRELRADPQLAELPIVMVTALEDQESRVKGLEAGADDFITKPIKPKSLRAQIQSICRLDRYRRIRNERARFAWVMGQAEAGYVVIDNQGQILFCNTAARTLLSLPDPARGVCLKSCVRSQFQPLSQEFWELFPALGEEPMTLVRPAGAQSPANWITMRGVSHLIGGETEHLLQISDVTAETNSERSVWTFEALISHKLRTPLTKMTWGLGFIKKKAHKLSIEKIIEFAEMSQTGVDELKEGLDEVLSYLNAPTAAPQGTGFSPEHLEPVLSELAGQLELAPIQVKVEERRPLHIGHRAFGLILWELCSNAKKFHPHHKPELEVAIEGRPDGGLLRLVDDGVHLAPEQLIKAFEPYYQGEKDFTGNVPGMGLGLAMVRSMVAEVGGSWSIRNRQDREGLVVELLIPYYRN